jgi:Zn-finger nucleic acid-binding protein
MSQPCPRCDAPLQERLVDELAIHECGKCEGLFLDQATMRQVIDERERAAPFLAALPRREIRIMPRPGEKMYLKCPTCRTVMNRKQFATGSGVVIDVCKQHGTFFDVGELPAIIDYVMKGGLDRSAKKDREYQRLNQLPVVIMGDPTGNTDGLEAGIAFVDLLLNLLM